MSPVGPPQPDYLQHQHQHSREPSAGPHPGRSGTPLRQSRTENENEDGGGEEYYEDDEDVLEEYYHERLPSSPARLDVDLPEANLDLTMTFESILAEVEPKQEMDRVQKRQSNVMKLTEQNERLKEELRAMTERLEAAERKQKDLETQAQRRSTEGAGRAR